MNRKNHINPKIVLCLVATSFIACVAIILIIQNSKNHISLSSVSQDGVKAIQLMEARPIAPIEDEIFQLQRQEIIRKLTEDPSRVFQTLADVNTVIIGDSRVVGFSAYNCMDESRILAGTSWSILELPAVFYAVTSINPRYIVVAFGINEISQHLGTPVYFNTDESYVEALDYYLGMLQECAPNAKIYYSSILPASEEGLASMDGFRIIPERNNAIHAFCEEKGYGFINTEEIAYEHQEMYREDGIHFTADFYPLWGEAILSEIIRTGGVV
ncbi:MAG: GDSL-type esterase/lipase family protein [Lachnospiraceae bacterium]|nr:GDSL-type esterase/lipase family protein [Lachnospiraceae bacterium]